jgi:glycosyltransferase involved in cell wall biosynthesis
MNTPIDHPQTPRRFLMIAPHFPPCRAVAAKRAMCFARHLPQYGWEPAVIALSEDVQRDPILVPMTPQVPMYRHYRSGPIAWIEDHVFTKFGGQKNRAVSVTKPSPVPSSVNQPLSPLRILSPLYYVRQLKGLPFDRFARYMPTLIPGALRFLKAHNCEAIYATGGPFSSFILAHILAKFTGLPLILDLRDPYTVDPIYTGRWSALGLRIARTLERRQMMRASAVILNTMTSRDAYIEAYRDLLPAERFTFIRNHFDPELFGPLPDPPKAKGTFTIIFFGHLTPIRNSCLFLDALRAFIDERTLTPQEIRFYTLGDRTSQDGEYTRELNLEAYVEALPWVPFTESRTLLGTCDLLLDLTSERHYMRISGKLYDYLAAERPILCLSENTEMKLIFDQTKAGMVVPNNVKLVTKALGTYYDQKRANIPFQANQQEVYHFSAKPAATKLAALLDATTQQP